MSRRRVAKGVAWAVPAITAAAAAPMAAASPLPDAPPTFTLLTACKSPGNSCSAFPKGYEFRFTVCNPNPVVIYLYTVTYEVSGTNLTLVHAQPTMPVALAADECVDLVFRADSSTSANQIFTAVMTVTWGHTPIASADPHVHQPVATTFTVPGTPPDCACTAAPA